MNLTIGDFVSSITVDGGKPVVGIFCILIEEGVIMVASEQGTAFRCNQRHANVVPDSQLSARTLEFAKSFRRAKGIEPVVRGAKPA
jgi:hypothetical protein